MVKSAEVIVGRVVPFDFADGISPLAVLLRGRLRVILERDLWDHSDGVYGPVNLGQAEEDLNRRMAEEDGIAEARAKVSLVLGSRPSEIRDLKGGGLIGFEILKLTRRN